MSMLFFQKYGKYRVIIDQSLTPNMLVAKVENSEAQWLWNMSTIRYNPARLRHRIVLALKSVGEDPITEDGMASFVKDFSAWQDKWYTWPTNIIPFKPPSVTIP